MFVYNIIYYVNLKKIKCDKILVGGLNIKVEFKNNYIYTHI